MILSKTIGLLFLIVSPFVLFSQLDLVLQTGHNADLRKIDIHPSQNFCLSLDENGLLVIWDLNQQSQFGTIALDQPINDAVFIADSIVALAHSDGVDFWDFKGGDFEYNLASNGSVFQVERSEDALFFLSDKVYKLNNGSTQPIPVVGTAGLTEFVVSESGSYIAGSSFDADVFLEASTGNVLGNWKNASLRLGIFEEEGKFLRSSNDGALTFHTIGDLKVRKSKVVCNVRQSHLYNAIVFDKGWAFAGDEKDIVSVIDLNTGNLRKQFKNKGGKVLAMDADMDKGMLVIGGQNGILRIYDLNNADRLYSLESLNAKVTAISFEDESTILLGYANGEIKKWDLVSHEVTTSKIKHSFLDKVRGANYSISHFDGATPIVKRSFLREFPSNKKITSHYKASGLSNNQVSLEKIGDVFNQSVSPITSVGSWTYQITQTKTNFTLPQGVQVVDAEIHPSGKYLLSGASDGFLYWIDAHTGNVLLKLVSPTDRTFFYITPENYYYASKTAMEFVGARLDRQLIGFEQIDLLFNRPDKVLACLPFFEAEYIALLEDAYIKRLSKLGMDESFKIDIQDLPQVTTNLNELPIKTEQGEVALNITSSSFKNRKINSAHVLINGVPVFGRSGVKLDENNGWNGKVSLTKGKNKLKIYVEDEFGFKSIREEKSIHCEIDVKPELYVLAIGSGLFEQESFNLKYAEKDAQDLLKELKESNFYHKTHLIELTGDQVSRTKVEEAISNLQKAKTNDAIIVFFAGHGVLDANLDYYLSAYEMNFDNPAEGGLLFTNLEDQLSNLPCMNKVLLIDACHSGEIDKEEVVSTETDQEEVEFVEFRSGTSSVGWVGGKSVFELSKNIFVDLRENSGVVTISSAGGAEYAMEGSNWNNGVFTYCLLNGIQTMAADLNGDKKIYTDELQEYLFNEVPKLTNGKQTPTSRVEILDQNIRVW